MSSDPLARPDLWAGAPNEAEYEAVYAAVVATERGRWFLTEYANRNRYADTHALLGALGRVEAVVRGDAAPDLAAAVERIQDVAISLREHGADAALCDALDAAAHEISGSGAKRVAGGETDHLPGNIAINGSAPQVAEAPIDDDLSDENLFAGELGTAGTFAETVADLAASLDSAAGEAEISSKPQSELASDFLPPADYDQVPVPPAPRAEDKRRWYIEPPDFATPPRAPETAKFGNGATHESGHTQSSASELRLPPEPTEDPADLFEPSAAPAVTPTVFATPPVVRVIAPVQRAAPPDPFAGMRKLSEEEIIALFG